MNFIDLDAQQHQKLPSGMTIREAIDKNIKDVLDHGQYILGPEVERLEQMLAQFVGVKHCICVSSGTDALLLALMSLDIGPGDEVITTPFSFIATAETIALLGAKPVFVDIHPGTYLINERSIESAITAKTKALIPVSIYGQPSNFSTINECAKKYGISVIEDAAQSFGSTHYGTYSCALSTIGVTSFFPSKPFGCYGDGGACFTNDSELANRIRRISRHGQTRRYHHVEVGVNGRMDTLQAAILLAKFPNFSSEIEMRQTVATRYNTLFHDRGFLHTPKICPGNTSVYAQYTIEVDNRSFVQAELSSRSIPTAIHYPTILCQQPAIRCTSTSCLEECSSQNALQSSRRVLSLPMHPWLTSTDQHLVVDAIIEAVEKDLTPDA